MTHPRQVIRERIFSVLNDATSAGSNVFLNLTDALVQDEKPAIAIMAESESIERISMDDSQSRNFSVNVVAVHFNDDGADHLAKEVELLLQDPAELEQLKGFQLLKLNSVSISRNQNEDKDIFVSMRYEAEYIVHGGTLVLES